MNEPLRQETCLVWQPLPARFSGNWQIDVVHLTEDYSEGLSLGENLAIAVAAYVEAIQPMPREVGAWRIDFRGCRAYRKRVITYDGAAPLTRPDQSAAFWELTSSRYLIESGVGAAYPNLNMHHYVILAEIHTAFEVLALGWRCTSLSSEWAKPFSGGPFPKW